MSYRVHAFSDAGLVRSRNEDAVLVAGWMCQTAAGALAAMEFSTTSPFVCAVADGMGGHAGGDLASRVALGVIADAAPAWRTSDDVAKALVEANERVLLVGRNPDLRGLGTTVAGVCVGDTEIIVFNVGDSRVYSVKSGFLQQVSVDDAAVDQTGQPTNMVTQSLGQRNPVEPHLVSCPRDGSSYLICTDGVSGVMTPANMRASALKPTLAEFGLSIIDTTRANGAEDNFSFVLIDISPVSVPVSEEAAGGQPTGLHGSSVEATTPRRSEPRTTEPHQAGQAHEQ